MSSIGDGKQDDGLTGDFKEHYSQKGQRKGKRTQV